MAARYFQLNPSDLLEVKGKVTRLSFILACTERLARFDAETMEAQAKRIAYEAMKLFTGESDAEQEVEGGAHEW